MKGGDWFFQVRMTNTLLARRTVFREPEASEDCAARTDYLPADVFVSTTARLSRVIGKFGRESTRAKLNLAWTQD